MRTSLERNTLYNNHPVTQFGPYSPLVAPRSNSGRVTGPAFLQISMTPQRWRSGRMWCQKNGGRTDGSFLRFSSRSELSRFIWLYTTMASSYHRALTTTPPSFGDIYAGFLIAVGRTHSHSSVVRLMLRIIRIETQSVHKIFLRHTGANSYCHVYKVNKAELCTGNELSGKTGTKCHEIAKFIDRNAE